MAKVDVIETSETPAAPRAAPVIKTNALRWNAEGFCWREGLVRLPAGIVLQDLNDSPGIWANIQANYITALRQFDRIRAVAFDESWLVDATVSHADSRSVILAGIRKTDMPKRAVALFENEDYKVEWAGTGYAVFRKSDGVLMSNQTFTVPEQAKQHLLSLYPRQVGQVA